MRYLSAIIGTIVFLAYGTLVALFGSEDGILFLVPGWKY